MLDAIITWSLRNRLVVIVAWLGIGGTFEPVAGVLPAIPLDVDRLTLADADGDFDPEAFRHIAFFNTEESRIEMHLQPSTPQTAHLRRLDLTVTVQPAETIWTESSHKFTPESVNQMLTAAGLSLREWYAAPRDMFGLALAGPA